VQWNRSSRLTGVWTESIAVDRAGHVFVSGLADSVGDPRPPFVTTLDAVTGTRASTLQANGAGSFSLREGPMSELWLFGNPDATDWGTGGTDWGTGPLVGTLAFLRLQ
jgi:hypothetical protein